MSPRQNEKSGASQQPADVLVLCYHAVSEGWPADLSVPPDRLEAQLGALIARGYRGATFTQAVLDPPAARTLAVTFDDAYRSVLTLALPILERLGLPGTVFAPTAYIGLDTMSWPGIDHFLRGPHEPELTPMTWAELQLLADDGWEIGSHTRTHPRLTRLTNSELETELAGSRMDYERALGTPCRSLAYPYGDHDARVVAASAAAGYEAACTLPSKLHPPIPLRWPRIGVYNADRVTSFRLKVSPVVRRLRGSPWGGMALRARATVRGR